MGHHGIGVLPKGPGAQPPRREDRRVAAGERHGEALPRLREPARAEAVEVILAQRDVREGLVGEAREERLEVVAEAAVHLREADLET